MSVRASTKWLTVCLYYNEPWEEFLLKAVKPYVDIVMQTGIAERFYYQRCWEFGPHIRLWFKGNINILEGILKPNIGEHFAHFFDSRPSFRVEPNYPDNFPNHLKWHPNNSLKYIQLDAPVSNCLNGALGLSICEKHYHASSKIILQSLSNKGLRWTYDDALSTANKLHLSFAFAIGMDLEEAKQFFGQLYNNWETGNFSEGDSLRSLEHKSHTRRALSFYRIYELQKEGISSFNLALWDSLENGINLDEGADEEWIQTTLNVNIEFGLVQEARKLKMEECVLEFSPSIELSREKEQMWRIYAQLVRLSNNRLGILNGDEGYLFYSLSKSLEKKKETAKRYISQQY
ncbi:hypothetical protein OAF63_03955 [Saprospiraceae bacterium]|nr:hypothetical protein [Saprospiraceae bacterium]MDF1868533.1 lantibiotic dehydratase C-terminal domain-containing protein [Saprospiraceae bacterium]